MHIENGRVMFSSCDKEYVKKFGHLQAAQMALDFTYMTDLPFIYDTYQLADFLGIQRKELFRISKNTDENYRRIIIKKKNGKDRIVYAPNDTLKSVQRIILKQIVEKFPVSKYAAAYCHGSTLYMNACRHCNKKYLLKLDITDFFGNIRFGQIYGSVFKTEYFPKQIGTILTLLCCRQDVLPQGAPTSPALSNIVMKHFDNIIGDWCEKHGISYTRYCDDLTFSSDTPLYTVYAKAKNLLEKMGFELNEKKTRFVTCASRQTVTGLTVNEKVRVTSDYKRRLRQEIYYVLKYGARDAILHSARTEYIENNQPDLKKYLRHLLGQINFVLQIEPENQYFLNAFKEIAKEQQRD